MTKVLTFKSRAPDRNGFIFISRGVKMHTAEGESLTFPCIGLYDRETGISICFPGFERWLFRIEKTELKRSETLRKKSGNFCSFLNWFLWNTCHDRLCEVTVSDLRSFMISFREKENGEPRSPSEWERGVSDVFDFLIAYHQQNSGNLPFAYSPDLLREKYEVRNGRNGRRVIVTHMNRFSVKPPMKRSRKYRLLLFGHLEMLLYEAKKYDPMLVLGIMLQSYAGLREGEVVNLTRRSLRRVYAGFGRIGKITIDLTDEPKFSKRHQGRKEFGKIKVYRTQEVFPDFISEIVMEMDRHDALLDSLGILDEPDAPLFANVWKKPMTVKTYSERVRKLFLYRFVPDLKRISENQATWAENAPYVEAYESSYPGAHMFRHWFTMYLLQYARLSSDEISKWRGDSSIESMQDYVHVNSEFIRVFRESAFAFQRSVLEEIL